MLGAIIGDIVGSPYEFANTHNPNFPLFSRRSSFTDDTICTIAVADAILRGSDFGETLREWCLRYPNPMGSYGGSFNAWLHSSNPQPYNSWGNGAAMRVAACGWAFDTEAETLRAALASAAPTHNHVEGLIGASTIALAIHKLRIDRWESVAPIFDASYGVSPALPAPGVFDETCRGCVPLAYKICDGSCSFEDAIRKAVVYGGDSDTLGAIVGSLAEARWGIPASIKKKALSILPKEMIDVLDEFSKRYNYEI